MQVQPDHLDPELLRILAHRCGRPPDEMLPETHIVFDLGIDGEDCAELIDDIEARFGFTAAEWEWQSVSCIADLNTLVRRLRGRYRAEAILARERERGALRHRKRIVVASVLAWLALGPLLYVL